MLVYSHNTKGFDEAMQDMPSKQMEVCSGLCFSVSECDWLWKRTCTHLRRNSLAHGLNDLYQIIKGLTLVKNSFGK